MVNPLALIAAAAAAVGCPIRGEPVARVTVPPPRRRDDEGIQRCYFGEANLLPPAPPKPLTKRQRRRLRGKRKGSANG